MEIQPTQQEVGVSELVVVAFDTETGAAEMCDALIELQKQHLVTLDDAAVAVRSAEGKVKVKPAVNLVGSGAPGGAFWGMLVWLLFWMPWLGMAIGALSGAVGGALSAMAWTMGSSKRWPVPSYPGTRPCFC